MCNLMTIVRSKDEPRYKCRILDLENVKIRLLNEKIANPMRHTPLKRCIVHPEADPNA